MRRGWRAGRPTAGLGALAGCLAVVGLSGCPRSDAEAPLAPPVAIEARDAFYDVAQAGDGGLIIVGRYGKMMRSADGGTNWQPLASGETRPLFSVAFADAQRGFAVGSQGLMLETADGGRSWTRRDTGTDRQRCLVRFTGGGQGVIAGDFGTFWQTADHGSTWTPIELPWEALLPELTEAFGVVEPHLYDLAFCGPERGWLVGEYGLVLATADGGRTWSKQRGGGPFDSHLFAVACSAPDTVVAAGQGGQMLFSSDGGATWTEERGTGRDVYDLITPSGQTVLALGDLGTLMVSTRAGAPGSWQDAGAFGSPGQRPWWGRGLWVDPDVLLLGQFGAQRQPLESLAAPGRQTRGQG